MLLDCAKLKHWNVRRNFAELFDFKRDYEDWLTLATEPEGTIGYLDSEWNDFDKLTPVTKLLHNTKRRTQPWKTGLPIDYTNRIPVPLISKIIGTDAIRLPLKYKRHPDPRQEQFFFALLAECLDRDLISTVPGRRGNAPAPHPARFSRHGEKRPAARPTSSISPLRRPDTAIQTQAARVGTRPKVP